MWGVGEPSSSSVVGYAEVRSAIAAAERSRRVSWRRSAEAVEELDEVWPIVSTVELDDSLALFAGAVAVRHGLRALDAIHLASALSLFDGDPVMVSWDDELRRAAEAEGLAVSPT